MYDALSLMRPAFTGSTNNFQLIYANCKTAKQNLNLSNIQRSNGKNYYYMYSK